MRQFILILLVSTAILCHAEDLMVNGVAYRWSATDKGYIVTGCDEDSPIEELYIPSIVNDLDVVKIAARAFEDNTLLRSVIIEDGVKAIGENAFCRCSALERVVLPEGLEVINEETFAFCTALSTMVIPASVNHIHSHAFMGCTGVTDVYFMMKTTGQLDNFDWWDGVYTREGEDEHGGLEFNRSRLLNPVSGTVIHVPAGTYNIYYNSGKLEAWLLQEDDGSYPLWWIVNYGTLDETYTVSDDISSIYVDINGDLYAKDDNHRLVPDVARSGEIDYMKTTGLLNNRGNVYDQSNWVAITGLTNEQIEALKRHVIKGGTLSGTLLDKVNPMLEVSNETPPEAGDAVQYVPNTYIPASFMTRTQQSANGHTYAFVRPMPQEYMFVTWSIYHECDDENEFYVPARDDARGVNGHGFVGGFLADYYLYEKPTRPTLVDGGTYNFNAINRVMTVISGGDDFLGQAPRRKAASTFEPNVAGGLSTQFMPCVLELPDEPIFTGIDNVNAGTGDNTYYDLQGRRLLGKPTTAGIYIHNGKKIALF